MSTIQQLFDSAPTVDSTLFWNVAKRTYDHPVPWTNVNDGNDRPTDYEIVGQSGGMTKQKQKYMKYKMKYLNLKHNY
jgi:hypothetical protein